MNAKGQITETSLLASPGRVLRVKNDLKFNTGLLVLTDDTTEQREFKSVSGCKLYTFP